jgi:starch synthase
LDVIVDADGELETGTGFTYTDFSAEALLGALRRGLSAYVHPDFNSLRRRLLRRDVGWDRTARRYVQVYRQARGESGVA